MAATRPTEEAYAELQHAYDFYNTELFDAALPPCLITFQRLKRTFGYFSKDRFGRRDGRKTDEIALNPEYFAVVPLVEVLQTLVHEMTHLWQEHFGNPSRACYHNLQWATKMETLGLMPSHNSLPGGKVIGQTMGDYVIAGGRFDQTTKRLLASGFVVSWLDRFPAVPPARPTFTSSPSPDAGQCIETEIAEESCGDDDPILASASIPPVTLQPELIEIQKTGNRSNRNKYTCPGCSLNVWGKPGLRVLCGDCELPLVVGNEIKPSGVFYDTNQSSSAKL